MGLAPPKPHPCPSQQGSSASLVRARSSSYEFLSEDREGLYWPIQHSSVLHTQHLPVFLNLARNSVPLSLSQFSEKSFKLIYKTTTSYHKSLSLPPPYPNCSPNNSSQKYRFSFLFYLLPRQVLYDISGKMRSSTISDSPELESNKPNENNDRVSPNGGARAWACVAGSFLLQFCSVGYVNA